MNAIPLNIARYHEGPLEAADRAGAFDTAALPAQTLDAFMGRKFPPRDMLLDPILNTKSTAMLFGWRGSGKTWLAHSLAVAIGTGSKALKWTAPAPRHVLLVDGEMPASLLQDRFAAVCAGAGVDPADVRLSVLAADALDDPIRDIATPAGQSAIDATLERVGPVDLLILDNLSTLATAGGPENEAESWLSMQGYLLTLRRRGIASLLVHHAGKSGAQRGTSMREIILDLVLTLKRPADYRAADGARFEVHFDKARGLAGPAIEPFEAKLEVDAADAARWSWRSAEDAHRANVKRLLAEGLSQRDVAAELGVPKSTVARWAKEWAT